MPSKQIKKIAWYFGNSTRIFKASRLNYSAKVDREEWVFSNRLAGYNQPNIRLFFAVAAEDMKTQVSGTSTGFSDLLDAIDDPAVSVLFYPVYEDGQGNTNTRGYVVVPDWDKVALLEAKRAGIYNHSMSINMKTKAGHYTSYPDWANRI